MTVMWRFLTLNFFILGIYQPAFAQSVLTVQGNVAVPVVLNSEPELISQLSLLSARPSNPKLPKGAVLFSVGGYPSMASEQMTTETLSPAQEMPGIISAEVNMGGSRVKANTQGISEHTTHAYTQQPNMVPPTATAQLNLAPTEKVKPYIGLGVNYTDIEQTTLAPRKIDNQTAYQQDVFGSTIQLGADVDLSEHVYLNIDAKKLNMRSSGNDQGVQGISQWVYGVGLGVKF